MVPTVRVRAMVRLRVRVGIRVILTTLCLAILCWCL